jgi:hypothetical protein
MTTTRDGSRRRRPSRSTETSTRKATVMPPRIMLWLPKRVFSTPVKKAGQILMKSMMSVSTRVVDAGVQEDVARVVEYGVDTWELLRARHQQRAEELHAVLGRPDGLGRLGGVARLGLVELLLRLEQPQCRVHVLLAVETRDDLLGLFAVVLHERLSMDMEGDGAMKITAMTMGKPAM